MANYTGAECLVCKEKFNDNDDIVVCPDCGTPYHRECYLKEGKCINDSLHENNKSWTRDKAETGEELPKVCNKCGAENKPHSFLCQKCGASLVEQFNFDENKNTDNDFNRQNSGFAGFTFNIGDKYCGMNPEEEIADDVKVSDAADFIGANVPYYLILFKRMKDTGKKISACVISLFLPQFYFAYRKMWKEAFFMTILETLLSVPYAIYSVSTVAQSYIEEYGIKNEIISQLASINTESGFFAISITLSNYISIALSILAFLFAHWLYYRHMQKKIINIKKQYDSGESASAKIISAGGTSILGVIIILAVQFILLAVLFFGLIYI